MQDHTSLLLANVRVTVHYDGKGRLQLTFFQGGLICIAIYFQDLIVVFPHAISVMMQLLDR